MIVDIALENILNRYIFNSPRVSRFLTNFAKINLNILRFFSLIFLLQHTFSYSNRSYSK